MTHRILDHRRHRLSVPDVRALLRLCNELHTASTEWEDRKLKLLHGLRELTAADRASAEVATFPARTRGATAATVVSSVVAARVEPPRPATAREAAPVEPCPSPWDAHRARDRTPVGKGNSAAPPAPPPPAGAAAFDWCTTITASAPRRPGAGGGRHEHCVHSFLPLSDGRVVACLSVGRHGARARFSRRDRSIVCALHAELAWVYHADVMLVSPEAGGLSRRQRETLRHLLIGKGEKQIAADMGVSHNTVHHYVKALHKHFGVSTRAELLARWVNWRDDGRA